MISIVILASCNKDDIINTPDRVGISKVTYYATITLTGNSIMSVLKGSTFTDPGVKAEAGGSEIPVTTTGDVITSEEGLYTINYSATNADGFSSSATRTVVVIAAHEGAGVDLSGQYDYVGSSTFTSTVTKVAEGTYTTDNAWSGLTIIPIIFVSLDGLTISIPEQPTPFGSAFGTGTYTPATKRLVYTISIPSQGLNDVNRNWQKL